jgi:inner membrane protein involved in colicin E2 resistance
MANILSAISPFTFPHLACLCVYVVLLFALALAAGFTIEHFSDVSSSKIVTINALQHTTAPAAHANGFVPGLVFMLYVVLFCAALYAALRNSHPAVNAGFVLALVAVSSARAWQKRVGNCRQDTGKNISNYKLPNQNRGAATQR